MAGVIKVEISESVEELHDLLRKQKTASSLERIQALYLLKIGQVKTVQDLAVVLERGSDHPGFNVLTCIILYLLYPLKTKTLLESIHPRRRN